MALPLGKLTILVGAVGSVLAKEGRMPNVSDFFSGALKIVLKQIRKDDAATSRAKPPNDSLLQQVNSLRQELQLLASSRPITVVTSTDLGFFCNLSFILIYASIQLTSNATRK